MALLVEFTGNCIKVSDDVSGNTTGITKASVVKVSFTNTVNIPKVHVFPSNNRQSKFVVHLRLQDSTDESIPLGGITEESTKNNVSNQPTWTDDLAGAQAAVNDIINFL